MKSRLQSWLGLETKASIAAPDLSLLELFGAAPSATGIAVTPRIAMTCAPVACAVNAIAEAIGTLPVHVYGRSADGSKDRAPDHQVYSLIHDDANPWTPAGAFRAALTRDALLFPHGGFAFINRAADGRPLELIRLDPETSPVTILHGPGGEPHYNVQEQGQSREIDRNDILHLPSPSLTGRGLVADHRDTIGLALILEQYAARLFFNSARPSGLLALKSDKVTPETIGKLGAAWRGTHGGGKSGGTAILPADVTWQAITLSSTDAQFLEMRTFQISEIARVFRVPPHVLFEMGRATWSNVGQLRQEFLDSTLQSWINAWQGQLRLKLLSPDDRERHFVEFDTRGYVRADLEKRYAAYTAAVAARILNPNEARAAENLPPYAGGDAFLNPAIDKVAA